jgi:hypothetical protein
VYSSYAKVGHPQAPYSKTQHSSAGFFIAPRIITKASM